MLARGRDVGFICAELYISRNTANAHRRAIYAKLGIHSQQELLDVVEDGLGGRSREGEGHRPRTGVRGPGQGNTRATRGQPAGSARRAAQTCASPSRDEWGRDPLPLLFRRAPSVGTHVARLRFREGPAVATR